VKRIALLILLLAASAGLAQTPATQPTSTTSPAATQPAEDPATGRITPGQAIVLGIVEGLTEYLPVSSTGHLILTSQALGLQSFTGRPGPLGPEITKNPAIDAFEVVIQLGAILAVVGLYRKHVSSMCFGLIGRDRDGLRLVSLLLVAVAPAVVVGLALHDWIVEHLFGPFPVAAALAVGGAAMIVIERSLGKTRIHTAGVNRLADIRYSQALIIGLAQCIAMWPGTSRSMVTILAALLVGINLVRAAEFSFLLALPTLGGATILAAAKDWHDLMHVAGPGVLLLGVLVSGIAAALAVKGFVAWLTRHGMLPFGIYRIALGGAVLVWFLW
jgi:undecaprenyl-diphosphatase